MSGPRAILRADVVAAVEEHADELDGAIIHARDFGFYLCGDSIIYLLIPTDCGLATLYRPCIGLICFAWTEK